MKQLKNYFSEIFTILAWITLLGFVFYCTIVGIKNDSIRDAWNILILIAGFVWGSSRNKKLNENTKTEITGDSTTITTEK